MAENPVQRRLAAILAADVVGYSRLMGQDEVGTLVAVRKLRAEVIEPKIAEHQGRLFKSTGDGFLVEFPSVVNAVACAVAIQKSRRPARNADLPEDRAVQLRIGINLGDVVVEGDDVFGDGVNLAARLESIASPGEIVVSSPAREQSWKSPRPCLRGHGRATASRTLPNPCGSIVSPSRRGQRRRLRPRSGPNHRSRSCPLPT